MSVSAPYAWRPGSQHPKRPLWPCCSITAPTQLRAGSLLLGGARTRAACSMLAVRSPSLSSLFRTSRAAELGM